MKTLLNFGKGGKGKIFEGQIIHSVGFGKLDIIPNGRIGVDDQGTIQFVSRTAAEKAQSQKEFGYEEANVQSLGKKILIPGFIDTHTHAPQYVSTGTRTGLPLLPWLQDTFNFESQFANRDFADQVYSKAVRSHLRNGSTTAVYFGTIHLNGTIHLADVIETAGQRAYIGKVNMDRNSPPTYTEKTDQSCQDTETFVNTLMKRESFKAGLVTPIITPRFVPTCTPTLMKFLGDLAAKHSLPIQSHISENKDEVTWVSSLHPEIQSYAEVYDKYGLLNDKTIMAHGVHLTPEEIQLFLDRKAGIAHCPLSNVMLVSGFMPLQDLHQAGVKIGLGTDVSGGYSPSMLNAMRMAMVCALQHSYHHQKHPLSHAQAFHLATVGGSELIGCEDKLGNFVVGKDFDALVVDPYVPRSPFDVFTHDPLESIFEKFILLGDDRNISEIYVKGKKANIE